MSLAASYQTTALWAALDASVMQPPILVRVECVRQRNKVAIKLGIIFFFWLQRQASSLAIVSILREKYAYIRNLNF